MSQILSALIGQMDRETILYVSLAAIGFTYTLLRFVSRLNANSTRKPTSATLFPAVKKTGAQLNGPIKCSLRDGVHFSEKRMASGDLSYNFNYMYQDMGMDQGHVRPGMDIHSHYYQPAKKQRSNVQIFSPSMSPNGPQFYDLGPNPEYEYYNPQQPVDTLNVWPQTEYSPISVDESLDMPTVPVSSDMVEVPLQHMPAVHANAPPVMHTVPSLPYAPSSGTGVDAAAAPVMMDNGVVLDTPETLGYPLLNDVLDVVYDASYDEQAFTPVLSHGGQSQASSDHSDHEYFSPPAFNYRGSPVSPDSTASPDPQQDRFVCPHCSADFRIKGYLTRHLKKHAREKAYTCPFYSADGEHKCHPTGGFSRRDTYKTHLKARHFLYPQNTPCSKRAQVAGRCSGCNKQFASNEIWVESHIQANECPFFNLKQ